MSADNSTFHWHSENWHGDRERKKGETGVRERGKGGQRGKDGRRKWGGWKNGKGVCDADGRFGTNKKKKSHGWRPIMDDTELKECACLYMCISVSTVLLLLTATVHERKACLCVHACISCKWLTGSCHSFQKLEQVRNPTLWCCPTAHAPLPSSMTFPKCYWPLGTLTGPLMKLLLAPIFHPIFPELPPGLSWNTTGLNCSWHTERKDTVCAYVNVSLHFIFYPSSLFHKIYTIKLLLKIFKAHRFKTSNHYNY